MRYERRFGTRQCLIPLLGLCSFVLALEAHAWSPQIFVVNIDGTGLTQLTQKTGWGLGSPQWSPDGKRIAADGWSFKEFDRIGYSATRLLVMNRDGSDYQDIGPGAMPDWSSDGKQLVFHAYSPSGSLQVVNVDGTGKEQVADHWGSPRWFANSNRIVSLLGAARSDRFAILDLATGKESIARITGGHRARLGFNLSPDGKLIGFAIEGQDGIGVATLDDNYNCQSVRIYARQLSCAHISWSPDGKRIVFSASSTTAPKSQLYTLELGANRPPQLVRGLPENISAHSPDWSPDGKQFVFAGNVE